MLVERFHLTRRRPHRRSATPSRTAKAGKSVALSIGLISLLITGIDIAGTVGTAYARAFEMTPLAGWRKLLRGWVWLIALLAMTSITLTLRYWAASRPWWFGVRSRPLAFAMTLCFYWVTPRLVLDLPFGWRALLPGRLALRPRSPPCLNTASTFVLANWFGWYGHAYGPFGDRPRALWPGSASCRCSGCSSPRPKACTGSASADTADVLAIEQVDAARTSGPDDA